VTDKVAFMKPRHLVRQLVRVAIPVLVAAVTVSPLANAAGFKLPTPGTSASITKAVTSAVTLKKLPANILPTLAQLPYDAYYAIFPNSCQPTCTWGNPSASKTVVLFGDSHVMMWVSAIEPEVLAAGEKLQVISNAGCPVATLTPYVNGANPGYNSACSTWRSTTISQLNAMKPAAIIMAERTTDLYSSPNTFTTDNEISTGLATTFSALAPSGAKLALIGDNPAYAPAGTWPGVCLGAHPTAIQTCATKTNPTDPTAKNHLSAEQSAAAQARIPFVDPTPWLCHQGICPAVVNNLIVYQDWSHITATYAYYLSGVMKTAIASLLR